MKITGAVIIVFAIASLSWAIFSTNHPFLSLDINPNPTSTVPQAGTRLISLYFPNQRMDPARSCPGIFPSERLIPDTPSAFKEALTALLEGPSTEEIEKGYGTEINKESGIRSLRLEDGLASVDLSGFRKKEDGTECQTGTAVAQIEMTLKQFPNVNTVMVTNDGQIQL